MVGVNFFFFCRQLTLQPYRDYLRGNWEIHRRDLHNPEFLAMDSTDHNFSDSDIDEYPSPSSRSLIYCRIFAISVLSLSLSLSLRACARMRACLCEIHLRLL